ncbi:MAG TPA: VOC family protein [Roseiflexaceae bacterium]|nr:VOC family protein [Roseiflexaceae bacterium]
MRQLTGLHHITATASHAQRNLDFYTQVLGLRLVKCTVNFDDPFSFHLYYGDGAGSPGTILTFFVWPDGRRGRPGGGQAAVASLAIPQGALAYWVGRLIRYNVPHDQPAERFGQQTLALRDPDGLMLELVSTADPPEHTPWPDSPVPPEHAIRGLHGATLWEEDAGPTGRFLAEALGFRRLDEQGSWTRYTSSDGRSGSLLDIRHVGGFWPGAGGVGTIHHLAWRTPDEDSQQAWRDALLPHAQGITPVRDREYFRAIYFREPGDVLLEIATDPPGFAVDEPPEQLGTSLMLPPWLEEQRPQIEAALPPLHLPGAPLLAAEEAEDALLFPHRFAPAAGRDLTLLLLHGTGGNEYDLLDLGRALAPGAALLSPRGPVLEEGRRRFFRRYPDGTFDTDDIRRRAEELSDFVELAAQRYGFNPARVLAVGYSNGANMAAALLLLRQDLLAGAVLLRPMVPLTPDEPPFLTRTDVFIGAGQRDQLIPPEQTQQLAAILEAAGASVTLYWHQGDHALASVEIEAAREWVGRHFA